MSAEVPPTRAVPPPVVGERPPDFELMLAKAEAERECRHCWHSVDDAAADNHEATCCRCNRDSVPTVAP